MGQIFFEDVLVGISKCSMVIFDYAAVKMFINVFWNKETNSNLQTNNYAQNMTNIIDLPTYL